MRALEIGVLGELTLARNDQPLTVTGPGRRALIALLAADAGRVVPLERIVAGLWGEAPPPSAVKVVQTHVSQLRRVLEPDRDDDWALLRTHGSGYSLAIDLGAVDAGRFETAVRTAASLPAIDAVGPLRDALALWRGPAYADIDRPFADVEAARLDQLRTAAVSRCLTGELARGRHREVEPELRAALLEDPTNEAVAGLLMLALYRCDQHAEALRVFAALRHQLADELGTDPGPSLVRLHEQILRHDPALDPPTTSVGAEVTAVPAVAEGNLPPPRTSFIGRETEVTEVAAMARTHRLTTLVGAGGAGKTRLALRAAREAAPAFDGSWWVGLGTLDDPDHLDGHCLSELGLYDQMDRPPADTLRRWIAGRHLLLVLDNCEHLADAVAQLVDSLLSACPRLHVVATSRQPLRCPDEHRWRVPALDVPEGPSAHVVASSEAGALFVARASDARPDFTLDDTTAPSVYRICRRLDGIPLAIELAAVRMATMSAAELADGLDDRFQLLTSGNRTALPRHRTLLATTDWSYELLPTEQQRLLCRLSTFVADFRGEAAAEVCGSSPLDRRAVPGLLADLVDHSLVETHEVAGHTRYRLLETVREYGRERLGDDAEEVARRYGAWVADLVETIGANAQLDTALWYARLDEEFLHVQGALAAAIRREDPQTALRIAAGSGWAPIIIGRFHRLREWLRQALDLAREREVDDRILAQGQMMAAAVAGIDHRFSGTLHLLDESQRRFEAVDDTAGVLWTGYWRAATLAEMGEVAASIPRIEGTVEAAAHHGLDVIEANARAEQAELIVAAALARGYLDQPALAEADAALVRARELAQTHGMQELSARVGFTQVAVRALAGDPSGALADAHGQLDAWRELGRGNRLILALVATAKIALLADRPQEARPLVTEALRLIGEFAWSAPLRGAAEVAAVLSSAHDPGVAATLLGAAEVRRPTHRWRMPSGVAEVRAELEETLGPETFAAHLAVGRHLDLDEAVRLASTAAAPR